MPKPRLMRAVADCAVRKVTHPEVNALGSFIVKDWIWEIGNNQVPICNNERRVVCTGQNGIICEHKLEPPYVFNTTFFSIKCGFFASFNEF